MKKPPPIEATPVSDDAMAACAEALRRGMPVIVPTDTVYGIAAAALDEEAVNRLYDAKGKERTAPLQLLFAPEMATVERFAMLNAEARALIDAFGPGGWTIIVKAAEGWSSAALAGGTTVGVRMPAAAAVHALVEAIGQPLAASSANRHGAPSPVTCQEALAQVGGSCGFALDGGATVAGLDSTIIDCSGESPRILREGAIDRQEVARILGLSDIPVLRSIRR
jgi:L-threonylcarbamoyladenylate synthase